MNKHFLFYLTVVIVLFACEGSIKTDKQESEAKTPLQKAAKWYCDCAKDANWDAIDMSDPNDPDVMNIFQKIMECNMEVSRQHGFPIFWMDEESDSLRMEITARCPAVIKKCEELSALFSNTFFGNGG